MKREQRGEKLRLAALLLAAGERFDAECKERGLPVSFPEPPRYDDIKAAGDRFIPAEES